jgi:sugar phosphate isomerase/epimerase
MTHDRRNFLKASGVLASGLVLGSFATELAEAAVSKKIAKYGIQLYTLRADMPKDPKGVLKQIASFGYKQIEGYEGQSGLFWGMSHTDFKKYLDELGLQYISSHCNITQDFEKKAAQAAEIGMKYLICPYIGPQKTMDDYQKYADTFNKCGEICKKNGIRFAYHNHGYTFEKMNGIMPQDLFMEKTDPTLVDFEMDIYWVVTAGQDPIAWLKKYPQRFKLCHVKDRTKGAGPSEYDASCDLGTGSIDFASILKVASTVGMKYYIVEQEKYENTEPLKSAAVGANYMKMLKI